MEHTSAVLLPHSCSLPPTYDKLIDAFDNDFATIKSAYIWKKHTNQDDNDDFSSEIMNPVGLLNDVVKDVKLLYHRLCKNHVPYVSSKQRQDNGDSEGVPFCNILLNENRFVTNLKGCETLQNTSLSYHDIIDSVYDSVFSHNHERIYDLTKYKQSKTFNNQVINECDLMYVFVAIVSLVSSSREPGDKHVSTMKEKLLSFIIKSLKMLPIIFCEEWKSWPFSSTGGSDLERDSRIMSMMVGEDKKIHSIYKEKWVNLAKATALAHSSVWKEPELNIYAANPAYDAVNLLSTDLLEVLFGKKVACALKMVNQYCVLNVPYLLASDTEPVLGKDGESPLLPSGLKPSNSLESTNNMTLVTRHSIPTARKLVMYFLHHKKIYNDKLEKLIAECMVIDTMYKRDNTLTLAANICCPEKETNLIESHVKKIIERRFIKKCGVCNDNLDQTPKFFGGSSGKCMYDFFPLHAFMDTYEASDTTCSANLCPKCTIIYVLSVYEKVTTDGVKIKDAFRCPCCGTYMVNWLGRCHEFSEMLERLVINRMTQNFLLTYELIKRAESCFSALEFLQAEFMSLCRNGSDFLTDKNRMFIEYDSLLRPVVKRHMLPNGDMGNSKCSLCCWRCVTHMVCDQPLEQEYETVDVVPPVEEYPGDEYVENAGYDIPPTDELVAYDNGPGLHKWPARLSCGFVACNSRCLDNAYVQTCSEAIAILKRIPNKKKRGWNSESPEGKGIIALANWHKNGDPPKDTYKILADIDTVFNKKDCFVIKAYKHPFIISNQTSEDEMFEETTVSKHPFLRSFFNEKTFLNKNENLFIFSNLFAKNLVGELLLQRPECVLHRAHAFVLHSVADNHIFCLRPDDAAKLTIVQEINAVRTNMIFSSFEQLTFVDDERRTVEWHMENEGKNIRQVDCPKCNSSIIKAGGCVTITCLKCQKVYGTITTVCWICKEKITESDHVLVKHRLLYSECISTKLALEKLYNIKLCSLDSRHIKSSYLNGEGEVEGVQCYVMQDGFTFNVEKQMAMPDSVE
uniref:Wsv166-like protein n=1 Tax=Pasiphaea japonica whispovirus TaxID=2984286 RepID=A0A9C7C7C4_9VIRU|nr:MAG: wsv166-like protein [Pasiphaea japonica whispovirus]